MKRVITAGTSFCGSTLLDLLLERAAVEVTSVGEIHHAYDAKAVMACYPCARQHILDTCPLTAAVREYRESGMAAMELYEHVVAALGIDVIHTSDKASQFITNHSDITKCDVIVLYKHPLRAMASQRRHYPEAALNHYGMVWESIYQRSLAMVTRRRIVLRYEDLCGHTADALKLICSTFGYTYDPTWVDTWQNLRGRHRVGGNTIAIQNTQMFSRPILRDDTYQSILSDEEQGLALKYVKRKVYQQLEAAAHEFG